MTNTETETYIDAAAETDCIFNFDDPQFYLEERDTPAISHDFFTPIEIIKSKLKNLKNNLTSFHINAQSIPKHYDEIVRILTETGVDILGVSETFVCEKTPKIFYEIPGYKFFHKDRTMKSRGGTGIYIKEGIDCKEIKLCKEVSQPEICFVEVKCKNTKLAVGVIYKSPLISYTQYAVLTEILAPIITGYEHHIVMGDFNIDHLKPDSSACKFFREHVSEPFDLSQVITEPTRITDTSGTLIDLFLVSYPDNVKASGVVDFPAIGDHCLIFLSYAIKKPKFTPKIIIKRKMDNFNIEQFKNDIAVAPWGSLSAFEYGDLDNKITVVENIYRDIMDKHCPKIEMRVTHPSSSAWRTNEIKNLQNDRDRYYTKFKKMKKDEKLNAKHDHNFKAKLEITQNIYHQLRNKVTHAIRKSKIEVFDEKINKKLKQPKQFHHALRTHNVVDAKTSCLNPIKILPNILNQAFLSNNNAVLDEQKLQAEITKINNKPRTLESQFKFSEITGLDVKKNC
jgi:exonuclease III